MGHIMVGDKNSHVPKKGLNRKVVELVEVWKQLRLLYPYGTNEASTNTLHVHIRNLPSFS